VSCPLPPGSDASAEYRHSDFGRQTCLLGFDTDAPAAPIFGSVKYTADQVTVRANWHLH
jgi:hypothetical protein